MNGKALERDLSTYTNHKYHNAWIDRMVSVDYIPRRYTTPHDPDLGGAG